MAQQVEYVSLAALLNLEGKVAIVTGGGMGIGRGIVRRLAEAGAAVVIADRDEAAAERAASETTKAGGNALAVECDVQDAESVKRAIAEAVEAFGHVDVLVNNAGIYPFKPALQMTADEWDRVMNVNLRGTFLMAQAFANQVVSQGDGGAIVNIGSIDSLHPSSVGLAAYDASKGGVLMFTKNLALELAPHSIRVNMVAPGGIQTEGTSSGLGGLTKEQADAMLKEFTAKIPMGRMGVSDDIATVVLFLASPAAAYMTGSVVVVDGGRLLN